MRQMAMGVNPTTPTQPAGAKKAHSSYVSPVYMGPLGDAASTASTAAAAAGATEATFEDAVLELAEEKRALPTFSDVTGVVAEYGIECLDLFCTPLLGQAAAAAIMNEKTTQGDAVGLEASAYLAMVALFAAFDAEVTFDVVAEKGRASLRAQRNTLLKNKLSGLYVLRIKRHFFQHVLKALGGAFAIVAPSGGLEFTHEASIPVEFFPAGVIEQIKVQRHCEAFAMKEFGESDVIKYKVISTSAAHSAQLETTGITLGVHGTFHFRAIVARVSLEKFFVCGLMGERSAQMDFVPEIASALNQSSDLVKYREVREGINTNLASIGTVNFVFSQERYDLVHKLFTQGRFKVPNLRVKGSTPLEVYVAPTLLDLQKLTGIPLIRAPAPAVVEVAEAEPVRDLRLVAVTGGAAGACTLVPSVAWEWRGRVAEEAASVARGRMTRRAALRACWRQWLRVARDRGAIEEVHAARCGERCDCDGRPLTSVCAPLLTGQATIEFRARDDELVAVQAAWDRVRDGAEWRRSREGGGRSDFLLTGGWSVPRGLERLLGWGYATRGRLLRK